MGQILREMRIPSFLWGMKRIISCIYYISIEMEESNLQIRGEMQQIFKVLSKEESDKMPFQGIEIAKSLSRLPFFRRFFHTASEHFINLCIAQDALTYQKDTLIYQQQAESGHQRYIYVVLEGRVEVCSEDAARRELGVLRVFGQTEVLFGLQTRRERVLVVQECKVMRIKESAVRKAFTRKQEIRKCVHFLDVNEYFKSLSELQKMQVALSMVRKNYQKGSLLKLEGEKLEEVLFFIYGRVEVTTHITNKGKDKEFVVDLLQELSTYGQYESTTNVGTCFKLRGLIAGAYYSLNFHQMQRQNHKIADLIRQNSIPYPNRQELQFLEGVKRTVREQQKRVAKGMR